MSSDKHRRYPTRAARRVVSTFALAVGVAACGSSSNRPITAAPSLAPSSSAAPPTSPATDAEQIVAVLHQYAGAYSSHDVAALQAVLSPSVTRFGAGSGGCVHSIGQAAVLADYQAQFAAGTGTYRLVGITARAVTVNSDAGTATVSLTYHIAPVSQGRVNFKLADTPSGWKVTDITATCHPSLSPPSPNAATAATASAPTVTPTPTSGGRRVVQP